MNFTIDNINSMCLDLLKEIGNIGSGNAATSLSQMINKKVDMQVPNIEVIDTQKVVEMFEDPEEITIGVYINFTGDIQGTILTLLDTKSANVLIRSLLGTEVQGNEYGEMERSVIQELGNIMTSGYVNAISMFSSLFMNISIPSVSIDMVSSILSVPAVEYGIESDKLILIENVLDLEGDDVNCYFFFMPDLDSFEKLFRMLGVLKDE
ncbi:chemotaxis protein CheC [Criibacterium bergeronii]|uniref:Chemotaxis protein CheC n=1 Tax=Criibacterium bergeronii TaxID=1871336 RepID=A0A371IMQ8_9FIRM|nr:chemotaxis protein CheC [Criibacterium bergeronii]MBS6062368.1 chemotaxis protein CheC [Peptostreptococcaceae bacterium]RDY21716.1 chemotaxis protein CheC [Criibacterium bergeronii]TRW28624.1 chemotaxis protein CheC [Criibacterium bergeronii]